MKTSSDPRHKIRLAKVNQLFAQSFTRGFTTAIDPTIATAAPEWPLAKINKIDLAVLRVAAEELLHSDTPEKVVIDEAVEIAKSLGTESSSGFINGVLGTILKGKHAQTI